MKSKKIIVIIAVIVVILLGVATCYLLLGDEAKDAISNVSGGIKKEAIKEETITADNFEDIKNRMGAEIKSEDELCYLSYSMMYYIMKDGMSAAFTNPNDESAMYVNIYGKTVEQLINEGKQLMKDNNITIEEYKKQLEEI